MVSRDAGTTRLEQLSKNIRIHILEQIYQAGSGHPGGSLSCADILAALYGYGLREGSEKSLPIDRDHVILSKGHAAPALYAALAAVDIIPREELRTLRQLGSRLQGHPDRSRLPQVEMSTGSLGQGLSVGVGLAWRIKTKGRRGRVYVVVGDGELNSGQVWEAIMLAGVLGLSNLVAIVDANEIQNDGPVASILDIRPYGPKFVAFGWAVRELDGHNLAELCDSLDWSRSQEGDAPRMLVAHTIKGRGVSFMEGKAEWHSHALSQEQYELAMEEVSGR